MNARPLEPDDLELATRVQRSLMRLSHELRLTRASAALSASKLLVLGILQQRGTATAAGLATDLRIQPQSLTRLLAGLEAAGLISRQPDSADRRQSLIEATPMGGEALVADLRKRRDRLANAIQRALTPAERQVLGVAAGLLVQVTAAIEPEEPGRESVPRAVE
jgi:DNA-binding MarR family transcriptional regulator